MINLANNADQLAAAARLLRTIGARVVERDPHVLQKDIDDGKSLTRERRRVEIIKLVSTVRHPDSMSTRDIAFSLGYDRPVVAKDVKDLVENRRIAGRQINDRGDWEVWSAL
jgi:hypothetical protein